MAFNGSGVFERLYNWVTDRDNSIKIQASRMDDEMDGMATGLSTCITRDGQTTITADLPMSGYKHTDVDDATARDHYAAAGQVQDGSFVYAAAGGLVNAYTLTLAPAITAYAAGQTFRVKINITNTGPSTINVNAVGVKNIKVLDSDGLADPAAGDIVQNDIITLMYDGTQFLMVTTKQQIKAAAEAAVPSGLISLWSGSVGTIPTGWSLCDGTGGTPDLRDRFVIGAGSTYNPDDTGGSSTHSHSITVNNHTLTTSEMPSHNHAGTADSTSGTSDYVQIGTSGRLNRMKGSALPLTTTSSVPYQGGGGSHNHTASSASASSLPPYYALAYIMKD